MAKKTESTRSPAHEQATREHILIIDDEPLIRRTLADYLAECGYKTFTAPDGAEGLKQARSQRFHMILVDLRMPRVDGLKVITALKAEQPELPLIVVSGTGVLSDAIEAIRQGAWDYVTKPIQDMAEIAVVVERVLERARLRAERDRYQRELEQLNRSLEAEVARQVKDLRAQNRELHALNRVSEAISAPLDLDSMLDRAIEAAIAALEADGGVVWLLNPTTGQLSIVALRGLPEPLAKSARSIPLGEGIIGQVAQRGQPHRGEDFANDPWLTKLAAKSGFHSCLCVPLKAGDETDRQQPVVGALGIALRARRNFNQHEVELMATIGNQIGVAVTRAQYAADLKQANVQLEQLLAQIQAQARQVQQIVDTVPEGVLFLNTQGKIILANPVAVNNLAVLGDAKPGDALTHLGNRSLTELLSAPPKGLWHAVTVENGSFEVIARALETDSDPGGWVLVIRDVTQEREIERRVQQQERLATVGQLAAGIAHDFNNLLTVITGYSEILLQHHADPADPQHTDLEQIYKAGKRASALTRKLLVFSRQQMIQAEVIDLNIVITEMNELLRRLISENIELVTSLEPMLGRVKTDPGQIEQIIMNLAVNARDAMPQGSKLTIETTNVDLDEETAGQHLDLKPGPYVLLSVSDTGIGMDRKTLSHIFEPFFTTKEYGRGTGLGLSIVYGVVQQSEGHITVTSQPGQGTTFQIYLPRHKETIESAGQGRAAAAPSRGTETILLVEDDEMVRELTQYALHQDGYRVLVARHGREALKIVQEHAGPIHLLLTDIVMPGGLSGHDLAEQITAIYPETKVLYMSGYATDAIFQPDILASEIAFLQKPFMPSTLARKVREALESA
ncbi:MAG: response regulator [Anaerolineae bacterium]|nr:response regulator [Anaerolineae bacterium]